MNVDLLVAADLDNEARVFAALATLPDNAVRDLQSGEPSPRFASIGGLRRAAVIA